MKESTGKLNEKLNFVGCDYRVAVGVYGYNTAINFDIPVFALSGNDCVVIQDFLATPGNDVFYIITKPEVAPNPVYAHGGCVKFFDVF